MSESLVFLDAKHKPSSRKRIGVAAASLSGVMALTGCNTIGQVDASPTPTVTVTVTVTEQAFTEQAGFQIERDTDMHVIRLNGSSENPHDVTDTEVNSVIQDASGYMSYDFDGNVGVIRATSVTDVTHAPQNTERRTGEPCYSMNEIYQIRNTETAKTVASNTPGVNNVTLMAVDGAWLCGEPLGKPQENTTAGAFAVGDFMFFSEEKDGTSYYRPDNFLHEYGHIVGLPHEGALTCSLDKSASVYDPTDNALQDIKEIVSEKAGCKIERNLDGSIYAYAGSNTIMADGGLDQFKLETGIVPAFSAIDKHIVLPDIYQITEIGTEPQKVRLRYGEGTVNGVSFSLPEDHPLRSIDSTLTKLTVALDVSGGGGENFLRPRKCEEYAVCKLGLYVSNDNYSNRIDLPEPVHYFSAHDGLTSSVLYLDEKLDMGLLQHVDNQADGLDLEIVSYQDALQYSQQQKDHRTALLKCYEEEKPGSDC